MATSTPASTSTNSIEKATASVELAIVFVVAISISGNNNSTSGNQSIDPEYFRSSTVLIVVCGSYISGDVSLSPPAYQQKLQHKSKSFFLVFKFSYPSTLISIQYWFQSLKNYNKDSQHQR
ncbi:hypothetical protein ACTA71_007220 [Dictyostelium dimigraforme]